MSVPITDNSLMDVPSITVERERDSCCKVTFVQYLSMLESINYKLLVVRKQIVSMKEVVDGDDKKAFVKFFD